jgi:hypothetical protein
MAIIACSGVTCCPEMSLSPPSQVSATTGSDQSQSGWCRTVHWMVPWCTAPIEEVLVIITGPPSHPDSSIQVVPVISPLPLRVNQPANTGIPEVFPLGRIAVTPVRTGPFPTVIFPSPRIRVTIPDLDAGHIGDRIQRPGHSILGNAEIACPGLG